MSELTRQELEGLDAELLPHREALSVIGPVPGAPGTDAAQDLPQIVEGELETAPPDEQA